MCVACLDICPHAEAEASPLAGSAGHDHGGTGEVGLEIREPREWLACPMWVLLLGV